MKQSSKLATAVEILNDGAVLNESKLGHLRDAILSSNVVSEDYYTVCAAFIETSVLDKTVVEAIKVSINNALLEPEDESVYFSAQLLTKLQAGWNCFSHLLDISSAALKLSRDDLYRDMVYPSSIVLGLCANQEPMGVLHEEILVYGKEFFGSGDYELAKHFARALCLEKVGNRAECFKASYDMNGLFS